MSLLDLERGGFFLDLLEILCDVFAILIVVIDVFIKFYD